MRYQFLCCSTILTETDSRILNDIDLLFRDNKLISSAKIQPTQGRTDGKTQGNCLKSREYRDFWLDSPRQIR